MNITEKKVCRACGTTLPEKDLLSLGNQAIVSFPKDGENDRGQAPLSLVVCPTCTLVQLRHTVDADSLYREFWYRSSMNEQMQAALNDIKRSACQKAAIDPGSYVMDIGSNDGFLLSLYQKDKVKMVGFEPAYQLATESKEFLPNAEIVNDYFCADKALKASGGQAYKVISAIAMFYDLEEPGKFLQDITATLDERGIFIVQMNYLPLMLKNVTFDNISHEHLAYYSLTSLKPLFEKNGLAIIDVETNTVNGGSIRVYARKQNTSISWPIEPSVEQLLTEEKYLDKDIEKFKVAVEARANELKTLLVNLKKAGKTVYAYGASTRGATLLQTVLGNLAATEVLVGAAERDERKIGRRMAGLELPIVSEKEAREKAEYFLLLPYSFWQTISKREEEWMKQGGKFILPVPFVKVASLEGDVLITRPV